jgi:hypothetical protein
MHIARTNFSRYQELVPSTGTSVKTAVPGRRLGWHRRLGQSCAGLAPAGRRHQVSRRLSDP